MKKFIVIALGFGLCCLFSCTKSEQSTTEFTPDYSVKGFYLDSAKVLLDSASARDFSLEAYEKLDSEVTYFSNFDQTKLKTHEELSGFVSDMMQSLSDFNGGKIDTTKLVSAIGEAEKLLIEYEPKREAIEKTEGLKDAVKALDNLEKSLGVKPAPPVLQTIILVSDLKPEPVKEMPAYILLFLTRMRLEMDPAEKCDLDPMPQANLDDSYENLNAAVEAFKVYIPLIP